MKTPKAAGSSLLIPRIVLTVSIIVISGVSYLFITQTSNILQLSARIARITGNQRTLSSQIISSIAADNIGGKLIGPPLDKTLANFATSDTLLFRTDSMLNQRLGKHNLEGVSAHLDNTYKTLLTVISENIGSDSTDKFVGLLTAQNDYLLALDKYTSVLTSRSTAEVKTFRFRETAILAASLAVVFLEIVWLFLPAMRKIKNQNTELAAMNDALQENQELLETQVSKIEEKNEVLQRIAFIQSHEVRHPLSSIMALVNLADEGHPVNDEWLQLMRDASRSLDMRIRSIIKETQTDKELKVVRYDKMVEELEKYAIVLLDAEGRIDIWNSGAENMLGYKDFEVTGKNFSMFYAEAHKKAKHIYYLLQQATKEGFVRDESLHCRKDGSEFYASTVLTAIYDDESGKIGGFTTVLQLLSDAGDHTQFKITPA